MVPIAIDNLYQQLAQLCLERRPFVVVTLVDVVLSAPQEVGAKLLVTAAGLCCGTIGGGRLEAKALQHAQEMLLEQAARPRPQLLHWNLKQDLGMTCGGAVSLFFEAHHLNPWQIAVFGAGHVAQALVRVLASLQCEVTCVDHRQDWLDKLPVSPNIRALRVEPMADYVRSLASGTYVVSLAQGHAYDLPIVAEILKYQSPPFIGVIGSASKATAFKRDLIAMGIDRSRVEKIHCPVGLDIGSRDPAEIAISITAQLLAARPTG